MMIFMLFAVASCERALRTSALFLHLFIQLESQERQSSETVVEGYCIEFNWCDVICYNIYSSFPFFRDTLCGPRESTKYDVLNLQVQLIIQLTQLTTKVTHFPQ